MSLYKNERDDICVFPSTQVSLDINGKKENAENGKERTRQSYVENLFILNNTPKPDCHVYKTLMKIQNSKITISLNLCVSNRTKLKRKRIRQNDKHLSSKSFTSLKCQEKKKIKWVRIRNLYKFRSKG